MMGLFLIGLAFQSLSFDEVKGKLVFGVNLSSAFSQRSYLYVSPYLIDLFQSFAAYLPSEYTILYRPFKKISLGFDVAYKKWTHGDSVAVEAITYSNDIYDTFTVTDTTVEFIFRKKEYKANLFSTGFELFKIIFVKRSFSLAMGLSPSYSIKEGRILMKERKKTSSWDTVSTTSSDEDKNEIYSISLNLKSDYYFKINKRKFSISLKVNVFSLSKTRYIYERSRYIRRVKFYSDYTTVEETQKHEFSEREYPWQYNFDMFTRGTFNIWLYYYF